MSKYNWVRHNGEKLFDVGVLPDGTLHNPRGYPDDDVRSAVLAADARRRERTARLTYVVAKRLTLDGESIGPRDSCAICGRELGDQQSIARGIGSECWQGVLDAIARIRTSAADGDHRVAS
jgi:hypothetical protein